MPSSSPIGKWSFWKGKERKRTSKKKKDVGLVTDVSSLSTASSSSPPLGSFPQAPRLEESFPPVMKPHVNNKLEKNEEQQEEKQEHHHQRDTCTRDCSSATDDSFAAAAALDTVGNTLLEKGDYNRAMDTYKQALELKRISLKKISSHENKEELLASVATSINNIGYLRQRAGASPQESMLAYQDSLSLKKEILGPTCLAVGKTLNNIGSVHYSCRQYMEALDSYQQALEILKQNLGAHHLDVATVYSNIGDVYMAQNCRQDAHSNYKCALDIRWMHLEEHDSKIRRLLQKIAVIEMNQEFSVLEEEAKDSEERFLEDDDVHMPVQKELHNLHSEVKADIEEITCLRRKMALDMVKDKLRILKEMKSMNDGSSVCSEPIKTPTRHYSPRERRDALSSVKTRLAKLKEQRALSGESTSSSRMSFAEKQDAEIERALGLEHLQLPKLNLESILSD